MRSHSKKLVAVLTYGVFLLGCSLLQAEETTAPPKPVSLGEKVRVATSFRASKLAGLNVRDGKGEKLGSVEDLVMDVKTGKISYLAMSFGMTLGLGGKLFAVPYDQVQFDHGKDEMYFIVHIPKDELKQATGFDKSNWPNFADPNWSEQVDKYYLKDTAAAKVRTN